MTIQDQITLKLDQHFAPSHLTVINESHMHSVPKNSETHFKVVLVSDFFINKRSVARHREVYKVLADELKNGVHALALHTYTKVEFVAQNSVFPASPSCAGSKKNNK